MAAAARNKPEAYRCPCGATVPAGQVDAHLVACGNDRDALEPR